MEETKDYVLRKLDSDIFNLSIVAKDMGVNRHTLSKIKLRQTKNPNPSTLKVIADYFRNAGN